MPRSFMFLPLVFAALTIACQAKTPAPPVGVAVSVTALAPPSDPPNAERQKPAFADQTRAPAPAKLSTVKAETIVGGLRNPWGVEALADGRFVVTEKDGALRVISKARRVLAPITGIPKVDHRGQGGLLDVAIKPEGADAFLLCLTYAQTREGGKTGTAASCGHARGAENLTLEGMTQIFKQEPAWNSDKHYGSRFIFLPGDMAFITTGERSNADSRPFAQDITKTLGKVVRVKLDGSAPADNPFVGNGGEAALVWSYGHRNVQAAALDANGALWTIEHGAQGGDELNHPEAGKNYGWPIITYGEDYTGLPMGDGITAKEGMEQPVYYWDPVIAPSGMIVYSGARFPEWKGDIFVGALRGEALVHLKMAGGRVVNEERFDLGARIRDVTQAPDGAIYVVTDEKQGRLIRISPSN
jgi:aldose sugar dehydrogenase